MTPLILDDYAWAVTVWALYVVAGVLYVAKQLVDVWVQRRATRREANELLQVKSWWD